MQEAQNWTKERGVDLPINQHSKFDDISYVADKWIHTQTHKTLIMA